MEIFVMHNGAQLGPFLSEDAQAQIDSGNFSTADYAWTAGFGEWKPLSDVLSDQNHALATPAIPVTDTKSKKPLRWKLIISLAASLVLVGLIITLGLLGRGSWSRTAAHLSRFDPAKDFDVEQVARSCTPSVMLIVSEGGNEGLAQGTGFVVSPDGLLITNYHVINGGKRLAAKSYTGGSYPVLQVVATDPKHDIAVLKIEGKELPFLQLDESSKVHPGSKVAVIGNPIGLESSVTEGIVSAVRTVEEFGDVLQISAVISPGSSGSPVLNADGKVIGVATFKFLKGEALNFAIPSKQVAEVLVTAKTVATTGNEAVPYSPNPLAKGSGEQDAKAARDPGFAQAKTMEDKKDYFGMLKQAKALVSSYPDSALAYRILSDGY
jgi:S1-C subfamily serine protease